MFENGWNDILRVLAIAYVDDLIVAGETCDADELRKGLNNSFSTKNLGELALHLLVVARDCERVTFKNSQTATIDKLLDQFGIMSSSPMPACYSISLRVRGPEEESFGGRC